MQQSANCYEEIENFHTQMERSITLFSCFNVRLLTSCGFSTLRWISKQKKNESKNNFTSFLIFLLYSFIRIENILIVRLSYIFSLYHHVHIESKTIDITIKKVRARLFPLVHFTNGIFSFYDMFTHCVENLAQFYMGQWK